MRVIIYIATLLAFFLISACSSKQLSPPVFENIESNKEAVGTVLEIKFIKGPYHNYPTFSFWIEDMEGNFIETLFVTRYLATGIYGHGSLGEGKWDNKPGKAQRPSTLPYWLHKKGPVNSKGDLLPYPENPMPDAITGATPSGDFILTTRASEKLPQKFRLMMEINQPWDWNEHWHNTLHPDDFDYKASCQPALVYSVRVDKNKPETEYFLNPIGHSHYAGSDGELYTNLTTLSTAREIAHKVSLKLK
jgi:hypothetical protein